MAHLPLFVNDLPLLRNSSQQGYLDNDSQAMDPLIAYLLSASIQEVPIIAGESTGKIVDVDLALPQKEQHVRFSATTAVNWSS